MYSTQLMNTSQLYIAASALLIGGVAYLLLSGAPVAYSIGKNVSDFAELEQRFVALAEEKGAVRAFEVLRDAELPPNTDLHLLGHAVGDQLYIQQGTDGMAFCTDDFRNACSHSIVIGTLNDYGPSAEALQRIDEACHKAPGGSGAYTMCYHGLGHGVFAYFGYDLAQTVAFCKRMGSAEFHDEQYTQCVGGAIMELLSGGGHDKDKWYAAREKYLTPEDPLYPCNSELIPDTAKWHCYSYLTPRLIEAAGADLGFPDPALFPRAFSFCEAIPHTEQSLRDSCFGGFGKDFVPIAGARDIRRVDQFSDAVYAQAASWCMLSPARDGAEACVRQGLQSVFWGGENDPTASFRFCTAAPLSLQDACYAELAFAIPRYLPGSEGEKWCEKLPASFIDICRT
jgi:hypothetical protein